jgi:hypothetical protein
MLRYHSAPSGHWLVAAAHGRLLAVRTPDEESAVERAWAAVSLPVQAVLDELTSTGLSSTPPFALVEYSGEFATGTATAHCIVRGDAKITGVANGETVEIDGARATTWAERTLEGVQSLELVLGSGSPASATLPLANGVAWVDRVTLAQGDVAAAPVAAAVRPAAEPAPVPVPAPAPVPAPSPAPVIEAPTHVAPPATPILAPHSTEIEDATIAEFTVTSSRGTPATTASAETPETPEPTDAPDFGYDSLFEETMVRSIEEAAVRPEEEDEHASAGAAVGGATGGAAADGSKGDHDGMTMMGSDFAALRAARKGGAKQKGAAAASTATPSAPTYRLEIAGGGSEPLSSTVLVGRAPSVSKVSGGQIPRLVTLTGSEDISRNHAQFSVEGDTVVVTDLHSRNGTSIILPGRSPQLLRAGEPTSVLVDTVVDLGGGVTLTVKEA